MNAKKKLSHFSTRRASSSSSYSLLLFRPIREKRFFMFCATSCLFVSWRVGGVVGSVADTADKKLQRGTERLGTRGQGWSGDWVHVCVLWRQITDRLSDFSRSALASFFYRNVIQHYCISIRFLPDKNHFQILSVFKTRRLSIRSREIIHPKVGWTETALRRVAGSRRIA